MGYIEKCYREWLLEKIIIECWTTVKCAKELNRPLDQVNEDLKRFLKEEKVG